MPFKDLIDKRMLGFSRMLAVLLLICCNGAMGEVTVTQLANDGVLLSSDKDKIMIDGLVVEPYAIYGGLPPEATVDYMNAAGQFSGVDIALASHRHHDHNQPSAACHFLQTSTSTRFVSSQQVIDLMREKCRPLITTDPRIRIIDPQYGIPEMIKGNEARITVFPLTHGTGKYSRLQNFGHLIEFGDVKVLHVGDAAMDPTDYKRAGLDQVELDVALIPFWYFQPGPGATVVETYINARYKIALHIPPDEMVEVTEHLLEYFPEVVILANPMDELKMVPASLP